MTEPIRSWRVRRVSPTQGDWATIYADTPVDAAQGYHLRAGTACALAHASGELVVIFDADHAPRRDFLVKTLGYFDDSAVGFVQTPQDFYNLDSYQHRRRGEGGAVWTEQALFFRVIQRGKDFWNAAFFCVASSSVTSRSGRAIASGIPGTPPPEPTSSTEAPGGSEASSGTIDRPSRACFVHTKSGSVTAVRFTCSFMASSLAR